jgi:hypothetical protein
MKKPTSEIMLIYAGIFFLALGIIEIILGIKGNSVVIGTIYIVGAVINQTIIRHSIPYAVTHTIKPEIIDLYEWSDKHIPESNHPDLCSDFVKEFRKRFDVAKEAVNAA